MNHYLGCLNGNFQMIFDTMVTFSSGDLNLFSMSCLFCFDDLCTKEM